MPVEIPPVFGAGLIATSFEYALLLMVWSAAQPPVGTRVGVKQEPLAFKTIGCISASPGEVLFNIPLIVIFTLVDVGTNLNHALLLFAPFQLHPDSVFPGY